MIEIKKTVFSLIHKRKNLLENKNLVSRLENDIRKRTAQLNEMVSQLEQLTRQSRKPVFIKETFLTNRGLLIQTPLNSLIGATEQLLDTDLTQEQQICAENIRNSGDSLLTIVNDILDYTKLEAGGIAISKIEFNIRTAIENVVDLVAPGACEKGLDIGYLLDYDVPEYLIGDPLRVRQIALNYLTNAVKHTQSGEVVVAISCREMVARHNTFDLRIEVSDTGIGVPEDKINSVFMPVLQSVGPANQRYVNTGLGLPICKRLATLMRGNVGVESAPGKGSTFWFSAPFEIVKFSKYRDMTPSRSLKGVKCLVISDSATTRKVLSLHIDQWGGNCSEAATLEDAIEALNTAVEVKSYDIAIIDFRHKDIEYYKEISRTIRQYRHLDTIRLVCLASNPKKDDAPVLQEYGYDAYLSKPIKQSHLYKCLLMICGFHTQWRAPEKKGIITKYVVDEFAPDYYRVLVVDDDMKILKSMACFLNKCKICCDVARNGKEAVEAFSKKRYDMVFMDCEMQVMNGYDAVRHIRKHEEPGLRIPVLAMTEDPVVNNEKRCLDAGMDQLIPKPFNKDVLLQAINGYFGNNENEPEKWQQKTTAIAPDKTGC
jgi:signal transduction histidine kinase/CheY-like chemotaxis protein